MSDAPYTPVVTAGGWIAVSGQVPLRDGAFLTDRPFAEQVDAVLANVTDRLAEAARLGFRAAIVPQGAVGSATVPDGMKLIEIPDLASAVRSAMLRAV